MFRKMYNAYHLYIFRRICLPSRGSDSVSCGLSMSRPLPHGRLVVSKDLIQLDLAPRLGGQPWTQNRNCVKDYWLFANAKLAVSSGAPRLPHRLGPKTRLGQTIVPFVAKRGSRLKDELWRDCLPLTDLLKLSTMIPLNGSEIRHKGFASTRS